MSKLFWKIASYKTMQNRYYGVILVDKCDELKSSYDHVPSFLFTNNKHAY